MSSLLSWAAAIGMIILSLFLAVIIITYDLLDGLSASLESLAARVKFIPEICKLHAHGTILVVLTPGGEDKSGKHQTGEDNLHLFYCVCVASNQIRNSPC